MQAGKLNRRVTIQSRTAGYDAAGQPVQTWATFATVWGNVMGATGMGSIRQSTPRDGVAVELNSYSIRVRYRTDLNAGMRCTVSGKTYDVKQIRLDMAGQEWADLICELGGNDG